MFKCFCLDYKLNKLKQNIHWVSAEQASSNTLRSANDFPTLMSQYMAPLILPHQNNHTSG